MQFPRVYGLIGSKLAAGEDVTIQVMGDTTQEGNHRYGWYLDGDGNRVDFDETVGPLDEYRGQ
jgi:hypothetical protein